MTKQSDQLCSWSDWASSGGANTSPPLDLRV